jgi:hypothetical protein
MENPLVKKYCMLDSRSKWISGFQLPVSGFAKHTFCLLGLLLLLVNSNVANAQTGEVTFTAYADAKEVLLNSYFELTYTLKNGEGLNFTPPSFRDFTVLSGPNQGFKTTIVNGRMSQENTISYRLQPKKIGRLTIAPAKITVKNATLESPSIQVTVVKGKANADDGTAEVFLTARLEQQEAFLGQQLVLDYILSARVDPQGLSAVSESDYEGFFAREIHQYDTRGMRELVNGVQYNSRILKRIVLYPQQTGNLTIDPLSIIVGIPIPGQRSQGFFSRPELRRVSISSEPITLQVKPLPSPRPENFSDITGNFELRAGLTRATITTDDAVSLQLVVEGTGDLKRIQAPDLNLPTEFEVYDPKVLEEEYIDLPSQIKGRKIFEYLLVPKMPGNYTFQPQVVVFNPDSLAYQTLTVTPMNLKVKAGSGEKKSGLVAEAEQNQGLYPAKAGAQLSPKETTFFGTSLFWILFLLPILASGGLLIYQRIQAAKPTIDPILRKQQLAREQALKRLEVAEQHRLKEDARAFYTEVERSLLGYVGDKLQIPRADMTKANVQAKLEELGANSDQQRSFQGLITNCEMALYAGKDNASAMEEIYGQAVSLLSEMEEVLGR